MDGTGLASTSYFIMETEVEILSPKLSNCYFLLLKFISVSTVQTFKKWNRLYTPYTKDGRGLLWTSDFVMDTEVEILCLFAVQCLCLCLKSHSMV